ncbi:alpha/beta hydrolase [Reyranella sp.]|uniref:alpha/beta hydrolase n=1 Tax=Reyranella sp. TaxID=1929291 RepID=UPI003D0F81EB
MDLDWRHLSAEEREREYSPSSCIGGNYQPYIRAYAELSAAARRAHPPVTIRYGSAERQTLDLFLPDGVARPPVLVFFHGGYWQELSKQESAFAAPGCLAHGIAYAAVDYTLAPAATLSGIVEECRAAVASLGRFDRLVVAGSSAGAHLAAMVALAADQRVRGAVLVSGIYDLEPLTGTSINDALGLDPASAARNSPLRQSLEGFPPSLVCWGENETDQFKRQSGAFTQALREGGANCTAFECAGRNHFDVILDLADSGTELGRRALTLVQSTAPFSS